MVRKSHSKTKKQAVAGLFNFAPHYRSSIFNALARGLDMDLYFGDRVLTTIKPLDYQELLGFRQILPTKYIQRFYYNKGVGKIILSRKYRILIFTGEIKNLSLWLAFLLKCIRPQTKICIWTHGPYGNEKGVAAAIGKLMYRCSDHIFLYGDYARAKLLKLGISNSKMSVVYNSLDYEKQLKVREQLHESTQYRDYFKNSNPTICYIGRIQEIKRLDLIVEAVALLHQANYPVNLVVVGDGEQREQLVQLVEKLKLSPYVWFYGASYDEEVIGQILMDAQLCLSPGNVGLTAIHALTFGCPVLTHNRFEEQMPEFEAIQPGLTGDFFAKDDVEDLARLTRIWLEKLNNPSERDKVCRACYAVIDEKYNPSAQVEVFRQAISKL